MCSTHLIVFHTHAGLGVQNLGLTYDLDSPFPGVFHCLLGEGDRSDLVSLAVVVGLGISPGVLRQDCDVCDVLRAVRAVVENVVINLVTCINNTPPQKALVSLSNSTMSFS